MTRDNEAIKIGFTKSLLHLGDETSAAGDPSARTLQLRTVVPEGRDDGFIRELMAPSGASATRRARSANAFRAGWRDRPSSTLGEAPKAQRTSRSTVARSGRAGISAPSFAPAMNFVIRS